MMSSYKTEEETGMHVRVEPYNPGWPAAFQREAARLRPVFGKNLVALHHIGSTAVPGLAAKPILDIMPVVWELEQVDERTRQFERLGYECLGEFGTAVFSQGGRGPDPPDPRVCGIGRG